MLGNPFWCGKIRFKFVMEDRLKVNDGNLVEALLAYILRGIRLYIHLLATGAKGEARKKLNRLFAGAFFSFLLFLQNLIALRPQGFIDDGFNLQRAPF